MAPLRPAAALAVVLVFTALPFLPVAEATHEWGHRFMFFGRILNPDGSPAQGLTIWISVETTKPNTVPSEARSYCLGNPCLPVQTDCNGLYYSYNNRLQESVIVPLGLEATRASGTSEEGYVMHIHNHELPSNAEFRIASDHGNRTGRVDPDLKFAGVDWTLDRPFDPDPACADAGDWTKTYVVTGHLQFDEGNARVDVMPHTHPGNRSRVSVTIETTEGPMTLTSGTNAWADYRVAFENVTVVPGSKVKVTWGDATREQTADLDYRVTALSIVKEDSLGGTALRVFGIVILALVVIGLGAWGFSTMKSRAEAKRVMAQSTRKRANK